MSPGKPECATKLRHTRKVQLTRLTLPQKAPETMFDWSQRDLQLSVTAPLVSSLIRLGDSSHHRRALTQEVRGGRLESPDRFTVHWATTGWHAVPGAALDSPQKPSPKLRPRHNCTRLKVKMDGEGQVVLSAAWSLVMAEVRKRRACTTLDMRQAFLCRNFSIGLGSGEGSWHWPLLPATSPPVGSGSTGGWQSLSDAQGTNTGASARKELGCW